LRGTSLPPQAKVSWVVNDDSDGGISGVKLVTADYCQLGAQSDNCFTVQGDAPPRTGGRHETVNGYAWIDPANTPTGDYHLRSVTVNDNAGNWNFYESSEFGFGKDLSGLFNTLVIKITD
jgi:hypothetical protein